MNLQEFQQVQDLLIEDWISKADKTDPLVCQFIEGRRKWQAEVPRRRARAFRALAASNNDKAITAIDDYLLLLGSHKRAGAALDLFERKECTAPVFWTAFARWWSGFDDTWAFRNRWLTLLRKHSAYAPAFDTDEARETFDALPKSIRVYRGCSLTRLRGLAWSLDRNVAATFARGHRGLAVPDPVIAVADIPKTAVFALLNEREESEVVLDPDRLGDIEVDLSEVLSTMGA